MNSPHSHQCVALLSIVITCFAAGAPSRGELSPEPQPQPARPVPLQIDLDASRVYVKVASSGRLGHEHGAQARMSSGKVELGGHGELVFDMRSFVADLPEARNHVGLKGNVSRSDQQKVTSTMLGESVLDVEHFPRATYKIAAAVPLDGQAPGEPGRYKLEGEFTLHGVVRPLSLTATIERTTMPDALRMRGAFAIEQSRFGITPYSTLGGLVGVADRLEIWGELVLRSPTKKPEPPSATHR